MSKSSDSDLSKGASTGVERPDVLKDLEIPFDFRLMVEQSPVFISVMDQDRRLLYSNRLLPGLSPEDVIGFDAEQLIPPSVHEQWLSAIKKVREERTIVQYQIPISTAYGPRWLEIHMGPLLQGTEFLGYLSVSNDVTDLRLAQEEVAKKDIEQRLIQNITDIALSAKSLPDFFKESLKQLSEMLGDPRLSFFMIENFSTDPNLYDDGRLTPADVQEFKSSSAIKEIGKRIQSEKTSDSCLLQIPLSDPWFKTQPFDQGWVYFDQKHVRSPWYLLALSSAQNTQIKERKEVFISLSNIFFTTAERFSYREQVGQADRLATLGTLAAGIGHEINNPLGSISMSAQAALRGNCTLQQQSAFKDILISVKRCTEVLENIQRLARAEKLDTEPVELENLLLQCVDQLQNYAHKKEVRVALQSGDQVPKVISINRTSLLQIITILVKNAIEASPKNESVGIHTYWEPGQLTINVQDRGSGIPDEIQKKIFEPFFTTKEPGSGTGLGLSIAQSLVHQMQGSIRLHRSSKEGSTFRLTLKNSNLSLANPS